MENDNGTWVIVELMGKKIVAGQARKDESFGIPLLRVDIPATEGIPAFSSFYGDKAVYGVHPVSEAVARATAQQVRHTPVLVYTPELVTREQHDEAVTRLKAEIERLRNLKRLPAPQESEGGTDGNDFDDDDPDDDDEIRF
jgi:hypothetical protein